MPNFITTKKLLGGGGAGAPPSPPVVTPLGEISDPALFYPFYTVLLHKVKFQLE